MVLSMSEIEYRIAYELYAGSIAVIAAIALNTNENWEELEIYASKGPLLESGVGVSLGVDMKRFALRVVDALDEVMVGLLERVRSVGGHGERTTTTGRGE